MHIRAIVLIICCIVIFVGLLIYLWIFNRKKYFEHPDSKEHLTIIKYKDIYMIDACKSKNIEAEDNEYELTLYYCVNNSNVNGTFKIDGLKKNILDLLLKELKRNIR